MKNWFRTEKIDEKTYVISEPLHWEETNCYLLLGKEKALLIDTGLGAGNILDEVRRITDLPVIAVPTHVHWDHIGGLEYFEEFYVQKEESDWISKKFPLPEDFVVKQLVKENALPDDFDVDSYKIFRGNPKKLLKDCDKIDLGNRIVSVLHTPGHSPGHMCFFEEKTGYLFTGDLIYKGTLYANYPSTDPEAFLKSAEKILKLDYSRIFPAHHSIDISPEIIPEICRELNKIKENGKLCHGSGKYVFKDWSIEL